MYYTSKDKSVLENYNSRVSAGEKYDGVKTIKWANILKHPDREEYAILINTKYEEDLEESSLDETWFENII